MAGTTLYQGRGRLYLRLWDLRKYISFASSSLLFPNSTLEFTWETLIIASMIQGPMYGACTCRRVTARRSIFSFKPRSANMNAQNRKLQDRKTPRWQDLIRLWLGTLGYARRSTHGAVYQDRRMLGSCSVGSWTRHPSAFPQFKVWVIHLRIRKTAPLTSFVRNKSTPLGSLSLVPGLQ